MAWALAAASLALGQEPRQQPPVPPEPPEEDEILREKEYAFNPLQATKEFNVGNFYFKRGSFKAAALRYEEALKWNPNFPEAQLKLGETYEKLKDPARAREVYLKFLETSPDHKRAAEVKKKIQSAAKS